MLLVGVPFGSFAQLHISNHILNLKTRIRNFPNDFQKKPYCRIDIENKIENTTNGRNFWIKYYHG